MGFVTDDDLVAERARSFRSFGLSRSPAGRMWSVGQGDMFRCNELAAALGIPQLHALEGRVVAANENMHHLLSVIEGLPHLRVAGLGALSCGAPHGDENRTRSSLHKVRIVWDLHGAGLAKVPPLAFRRAMQAALNAEGVESVLWEEVPLSDHPVFANAAQQPDSDLFPSWARDDPARYGANVTSGFPKTRALLDNSLLLFSQKRPLVAQTTEAVLSMGIALAKVWLRRDQLAAWALEQIADNP